MKRIILASMMVSMLSLTGCTTYQYSARHADINRQDIQATPTVVDVKADFTKRVNVTSNWQRTKEDAMAECQYMAITDNKIDIVVDPIYKIEYRPNRSRKKYKASLVGFGGYYQNSRTQLQDIEALKTMTREDIEKYLILHNPEILQYLNAQGEVINIYHNDGESAKKCDNKPAEPVVVQPQQQTKPQSKPQTQQQTKKTGFNKSK